VLALAKMSASSERESPQRVELRLSTIKPLTFRFDGR